MQSALSAKHVIFHITINHQLNIPRWFHAETSLSFYLPGKTAGAHCKVFLLVPVSPSDNNKFFFFHQKLSDIDILGTNSVFDWNNIKMWLLGDQQLSLQEMLGGYSVIFIWELLKAVVGSALCVEVPDTALPSPAHLGTRGVHGWSWSYFVASQPLTGPVRLFQYSNRMIKAQEVYSSLGIQFLSHNNSRKLHYNTTYSDTR